YGEEGITFFPGVTSQSCLDGFTIRRAFAIGQGCAVYILGASPVIRNCIITESRGFGAPLYVTSAAPPEIVGCVFSNNESTYLGGGIFSLTTPSFQISDCLFVNNHAQHAGGLVYNYSAPTVTHCMFYGNRSDFGAGQIQLQLESSAHFENCIIAF